MDQHRFGIDVIDRKIRPTIVVKIERCHPSCHAPSIKEFPRGVQELKVLAINALPDLRKGAVLLIGIGFADVVIDVPGDQKMSGQKSLSKSTKRVPQFTDSPLLA